MEDPNKSLTANLAGPRAQTRAGVVVRTGSRGRGAAAALAREGEV